MGHHRVSSENDQSSLKARLTDLAHLYCGEEIDSRDFAFHGECFRALNSLHSNENIVINKPDKGSGVVILNKNDFIDKMLGILDDPSKFEKLGPTSSNDNTANIESKLQKRLLELFKKDSIPKSLYQNIRPTGSSRPRMYGLPKTHKTNIPLRPILSMTGSSHHELSKWLASLLEPVLKRFSTHCIRDSFTVRLLMLFKTLKMLTIFSCAPSTSQAFLQTSYLKRPLISVQTPYIAMIRMHNHLFLRLSSLN